MKTKIEIEKKEKEFKKWARNDSKYYVYNNRNDETITEYFSRFLKVYDTERLIKQFDYSPEQADYMFNYYNTEFWRGYEYWKNRKEKEDLKMKKYNVIFKEAEEYAKTIDVSDIKDGFPCGSAFLYLAPNTDKELEKLLKSKNDGSSDPFQLYLHLKMPSYGQCISFYERLCSKTKEFLSQKGIETLVYSWID